MQLWTDSNDLFVLMHTISSSLCLSNIALCTQIVMIFERKTKKTKLQILVYVLRFIILVCIFFGWQGWCGQIFRQFIFIFRTFLNEKCFSTLTQFHVDVNWFAIYFDINLFSYTITLIIKWILIRAICNNIKMPICIVATSKWVFPQICRSKQSQNSRLLPKCVH